MRYENRMKNRDNGHPTATIVLPPSAILARDIEEPPPSGPPCEPSDGAVVLLLDTLQTTVSEHERNPLKRHEKRKISSHTLSDKVERFDPVRGQRMRECGHIMYRDVCKGCGTEKYRKNGRCMDRLCPSCAHTRSGRLAGKYADRVNKRMSGRHGYHLVLTVKNTRELPDYNAFMAMFDAMRKHEFWKPYGGMVAGLRAVEVTKKAGCLWHPHFHVLMFTREPLPLLPDGQWTIPFNQAVADAWCEVTGGKGKIVRGSRFDGRAVEMVKYIGKPSDVERMSASEVEELCNWTKRTVSYTHLTLPTNREV